MILSWNVHKTIRDIHTCLSLYTKYLQDLCQFIVDIRIAYVLSIIFEILGAKSIHLTKDYQSEVRFMFPGTNINKIRWRNETHIFFQVPFKVIFIQTETGHEHRKLWVGNFSLLVCSSYGSYEANGTAGTLAQNGENLDNHWIFPYYWHNEAAKGAIIGGVSWSCGDNHPFSSFWGAKEVQHPKSNMTSKKKIIVKSKWDYLTMFSTHLKNVSSNWIISPSGDKTKTCFKPQPSYWHKKAAKGDPTVDGSENPARKPAEVGSWNPSVYNGFCTSQVVVWDFFTQQYQYLPFRGSLMILRGQSPSFFNLSLYLGWVIYFISNFPTALHQIFFHSTNHQLPASKSVNSFHLFPAKTRYWSN